MGLWISFPAMVESQCETQSLYSSLFGNTNQARLCTEFLGQMRLPTLLSRWGKPQPILSLFKYLCTCGYWIGCVTSHVLWLSSFRLKAVCSNEWGYELDSLPTHDRKSSSKVSKAICCLKPTHTSSSLTKQSHLLCSANYGLWPPAPQFEWYWAAHLPGVVSSPAGQKGPKNTHFRRWNYVSAPLPRQAGERLLQDTLNFPNRLSGWEGPGAILCLG